KLRRRTDARDAAAQDAALAPRATRRTEARAAAQSAVLAPAGAPRHVVPAQRGALAQHVALAPRREPARHAGQVPRAGRAPRARGRRSVPALGLLLPYAVAPPRSSPFQPRLSQLPRCACSIGTWHPPESHPPESVVTINARAGVQVSPRTSHI